MSLKSEVRLNSDYSYSLSLSVTITITIWQITAASFKLGSWHSDARRALCFFFLSRITLLKRVLNWKKKLKLSNHETIPGTIRNWNHWSLMIYNNITFMIEIHPIQWYDSNFKYKFISISISTCYLVWYSIQNSISESKTNQVKEVKRHSCDTT